MAGPFHCGETPLRLGDYAQPDGEWPLRNGKNSPPGVNRRGQPDQSGRETTTPPLRTEPTPVPGEDSARRNGESPVAVAEAAFHLDDFSRATTQPGLPVSEPALDSAELRPPNVDSAPNTGDDSQRCA